MKVLLLKSIGVATVSILLVVFLINPMTSKEDENIKVALFGGIVVSWALLSAFLYQRVDEEWKKTQTAVIQNDYETFRIEAPKRIPKSFVMLYRLIAIIAGLGSWMFHIQSVEAYIGFFLFYFVIGFVYWVIQDLDNPLSGIVNVESIPEEWIVKMDRQDEVG